MHTIWAGAKCDVWTKLSVAASFTYQRQNDFLPKPGICTGSGINISSPKCAGSESAISLLIDYKPFARADLYGGIMVSNVYGGLANGYFKPQTSTRPWACASGSDGRAACLAALVTLPREPASCDRVDRRFLASLSVAEAAFVAVLGVAT
jgi:hypothetical protein